MNADVESGVGWDRVGAVRRARRVAGLSQRGMAGRAGLARSTVARAECPEATVSLEVLTALLAVAGHHLAVVDATGQVVGPMRAHTVRDRVGRRFPAHLDTVLPGDFTPAGRQWHYARPTPEVTFARGGIGNPHPEAPAPGRPDDHVTEEELAVMRREEIEALRARFPRPVSPPLAMCACGPECELHCVPECPCQCEPPGIELRSLYVPPDDPPDHGAPCVEPLAEPPAEPRMGTTASSTTRFVDESVPDELPTEGPAHPSIPSRDPAVAMNADGAVADTSGATGDSYTSDSVEIAELGAGALPSPVAAGDYASAPTRGAEA